jgi:multidrug efflux pump subunit AcrA (membrane-fusion protein)
VYKSSLALYEKTGSVSKEEMLTKELEYKLAQAEYEKLKMAEEMEQYEYKMSLEKRDKRLLKSPFKGFVTEILLSVGESCENRQPIVRVVDTSRCLLVCNIEASLGLNLVTGDIVDIEIPSGTKTIIKKGRIIYVAAVVDPASGLMMVKAEFDNADGKIRPGIAASMIFTAVSG